jgi:hypothetical protein
MLEKLLSPISPTFIGPVVQSSRAWRFPTYARAFLDVASHAPGSTPPAPLLDPPWLEHLLKPLLPATSIEWRYFSIISPAFHGIVAFSLFNPFNRFDRIAEGGLLCIVAGVFDAARNAEMLTRQVERHELRQMCWMHMFPVHCLDISEGETTVTRAEWGGVKLHMVQLSPQQSTVEIDSDAGLHLDLRHDGLDGTEVPPAPGHDLRRVPGAHWIIYNPSPIARTSGEITVSAEFLHSIANPGGRTFPNIVSADMHSAAVNGYTARWNEANGYYEHSFGLNPLPLHGWDFLFVPDAARGQGVVMQTYVRSRALRYLEVFWQEDGLQRYSRFEADQMTLEWHDVYDDPEIQVRLPRRRRITGRKPGLRLEMENIIPHQIPLVRPDKLAVRHFFISEHISFCSWKLTDDGGRVLAEVEDFPCGGEVAHFRAKASRV